MQKAPPKLKKYARDLRKDMTPTETKLWAALRDRRYVQLKFRRQRTIGPFIADFCCLEKKVIVELDGDSHAGKEDYDSARQKWLENDGWTVLRFWDSDVYGDIEGVIQAVFNACCLSDASPSHREGVPSSALSPRGEGNGNGFRVP
ncbi:MAG: endonuclease domain-containing protein [Planctomycetota bacterium]